jgi:hypothetical protein
LPIFLNLFRFISIGGLNQKMISFYILINSLCRYMK